MKKVFSTKQEAIDFLTTLPFNTMIDLAADALLQLQGKPTRSKIVISEAQFREFFRIRGTNDSGEAETRGRKPKAR